MERGSTAESNQFVEFSLDDREKMMERETVERYVSPTCTYSHSVLDRAAALERLFSQGAISECGIEGSGGPYIQMPLRVMLPIGDFEENLMKGRELMVIGETQFIHSEDTK